MENKTFKYYAFISYSHDDKCWAKRLHKKLETYRLPNTIIKQSDRSLPKRLKPVFKDDTDISVGGFLEYNLIEKLRESKYLIVICSPKSAQSDYVNAEIQEFININSGSRERIIPLIIKGFPDSNDPLVKCYPSNLDTHVMGASVKELGRKKAFLKIVAKILEIDFDELYKRDKRRMLIHFIRNTLLFLCITIGLIVFFQKSIEYSFLNQYITIGRVQLEKQNLVTAALMFKKAMKFNSCSESLRQDLFENYEQCYYRDPSFAYARCPHGSPITCVSIDPTETLLGMGSDDGKVTVWNVKNGERELTIPSDGAIKALCFSYGDNYLYTLKENGEMTIWDLKTAENRIIDLQKDSSHDIYRAIEIDSTDTYVSVSILNPNENLKKSDLLGFNFKVIVYDIKNDSVLFDPNKIECSSFDSNASYVECDNKGNIKVYDLIKNTFLSFSIPKMELSGKPKFIKSFNNEWVYLLTDTWQNYLVDLKNKKIIKQCNYRGVECILPNKTLIARNTQNQRLEQVDCVDFNKIKTLDLYPNTNYSIIASSNSSDTLACFFKNGINGISLYDCKKNQLLYDIFPSQSGTITNCCMSEHFLAVVSDDGWGTIYPRYFNNLVDYYRWNPKNKENRLYDVEGGYGLSYNSKDQCIYYCLLSNGEPEFILYNQSDLINAKIDLESQRIFLLFNQSGEISLKEVSLIKHKVVNEKKWNHMYLSSSFSENSEWLVFYYKKDFLKQDIENERIRIINLKTLSDYKDFNPGVRYINLAISDDAKTIMGFNDQKKLYLYKVDSLKAVDYNYKLNSSYSYLPLFSMNFKNKNFIVSYSNTYYGSDYVIMADGYQEYVLHSYFSNPSKFIFAKLIDNGEHIFAQKNNGEIYVWRNLMKSEEIINGIDIQLDDRKITEFEKETYGIGLEYILNEVDY